MIKAVNTVTLGESPTTATIDEDALIREHLVLVHRTVSQTASRVPSHVSRDDLMSAGMAGLAHAARHYDPRRGVPFDRYAATRIRGAILDELRGFDWASRPVRSKARALAGLNEKLTATLGRIPTEQELAEAAGLSRDDLRRLSGDVHRSVVLNYEAIVEAGDAEFLLPAATDDPEEELLLRERVDFLATAMQALPERLQTVIRGYFFEERSVTDIADELGVTQSRVSQLRGEALELLRDGMDSQFDPSRSQPLRRASGRVSRRKVAYRAAMKPAAVAERGLTRPASAADGRDQSVGIVHADDQQAHRHREPRHPGRNPRLEADLDEAAGRSVDQPPMRGAVGAAAQIAALRCNRRHDRRPGETGAKHPAEPHLRRL